MDKTTGSQRKRTADNPPVGISPTEFARRHVVYRLNSLRAAIVLVIASQADSRGKARTIQRYIAEDLGKSLRTIERAMVWLLSEDSGPVLRHGGGRTYVLVGYVEHDPYTCRNVECESDYTHRLDGYRKKAAARDRQRRRRERLKAAENV